MLNNQLVGIGKVENGRMSFIGADGKGFSRPLSTKKDTVVTRKKEVVLENKERDLDVPDFMKKRVEVAKQDKKVIHVDFGYEKEEELSIPEQIVEGILHRGKKILRPIQNYFFGEDE